MQDNKEKLPRTRISILMIVIAIVIVMLCIFPKVQITTDIRKYNEQIGKNATGKYEYKWGMNEDIFPQYLNNRMKVNEYKMVYYNPWDAQFLAYLVIEYNENDYEKEVKRLKEYTSTEYMGYYDITGFSKYELLAMYADEYQGFVYALNSNNKNEIIYVELIFCNYFYDIDYKKYINNDYLPDGFNATEKNAKKYYK